LIGFSLCEKKKEKKKVYFLSNKYLIFLIANDIVVPLNDISALLVRKYQMVHKITPFFILLLFYFYIYIYIYIYIYNKGA
jgi:hypothetical protein